MYFVERNRTEITVTGPDGWKRSIPANAVIVITTETDCGLRRTAIAACDMSDAEIVNYLLEFGEQADEE
jgi:hypothetical protein